MLKVAFAVFVIVLFPPAVYSQPVGSAPAWGNWATWGDQGNGTYHNPVLPGDFSDVDCIKVDSNYYAVLLHGLSQKGDLCAFNSRLNGPVAHVIPPRTGQVIVYVQRINT